MKFAIGGVLLCGAALLTADPARAQLAPEGAAAAGDCVAYDSDFAQYDPFNFIGDAANVVIASEVGGVRVAAQRPGAKKDGSFRTGPLDCARFSEIKIEFIIHRPTEVKKPEQIGFQIQFGETAVDGLLQAAGEINRGGQLTRFHGVGATVDGGSAEAEIADGYTLSIVAGRNNNIVYYLNGKHVTTLAHDYRVKEIVLSGLGPEEAVISVKVR